MAAADATAAMTIDFLRARLLSERSVSRAAKERADQLARRVAELEEQLRTVSAQRRKAERAAAEVLAILDSQGFGRLSDATDGSGSEAEGPGAAEVTRGGGNARGDAPEDAMSGLEPGGQAAAAAAAQAGGLSWKGRATGPDWDRRRPQQQLKGRQLRQRHGNGHRRDLFYSRAADSSPKYHPGQSCRKIKKKELRSQTSDWEGKEDIAGESAEEGQERSDCTVCTDEQPDLDCEVSNDGQGSSSSGKVGDGRDRYNMNCGKDGEMERVLEKQAELIGQYEAEENAQREWEKKFSESRDSSGDNVNLSNKLNLMENACEKRKTAQIMDNKVATATVASSDGELQVRKDVLASTKNYLETVEGTSNKLENSAPAPQGRCDISLIAAHNKGQGDGNSDSCSSCNADARSSERNRNTPSVGSPSSDTPKSEVSEWSSSCFHNHTDNLLDMQLYQSSGNDVGGILEALQRAKMSLREKLSRPCTPSQNLLALSAPEDRYTKYDLPVNEMQLSLSRSTVISQEMLALQEPAYYLNRIAAQDDTELPVGHAGLFRVPTDSFPTNWMASSDGYGSRFSLTGTTQSNTSPSHVINHIRASSPFSRYGSGSYPYSSMLVPVPTSGGCSIRESDFRIRAASPPWNSKALERFIRRKMPS